jgi:hypothetical protein
LFRYAQEGRAAVRKVIATIAVLMMSGVTAMIGTGTAQAYTTAPTSGQASTVTPASAADCEHGANGFVDIPDTLGGEPTNGEVVRVADPAFNIAFVQLRQGTVQGRQRGWAMINGPTTSGERVWMDWRRPGISGWVQCGPFTVTASGQMTQVRWRPRLLGLHGLVVIIAV